MSIQDEPRLHDLVFRTDEHGRVVRAFFILNGSRRTTDTPVDWRFDPADEYTISDAALVIDQQFYNRNHPKPKTFWEKVFS